MFTWTQAWKLLVIQKQLKHFVIAVCCMFLALICPLVSGLPDFHNWVTQFFLNFAFCCEMKIGIVCDIFRYSMRSLNGCYRRCISKDA